MRITEKPTLGRKFTAIVLLASFLLSNSVSTPGYSQSLTGVEALDPHSLKASQNVQPLSPARLNLPSEIGTIEDSFQGSSGQSVIVIQDAHAIGSAQESVLKIIQWLSREFGISLIGLEGGSGNLDPTLFRNFPDRERLEKVFGDYLESGELSGAAAASVLNASEAEFFGVEDQPLYEEGIDLFLKALRQQSKWVHNLEALEQNLEASRKKKFSKELYRIERTVKDFFQSNSGELAELLEVLEKQAPENLKLSKTNTYPHLTALYKEINAGALADDAAIQKSLSGFVAAVQKKLKATQDRQKFSEMLQDFKTERISWAALTQDLAGFVKEREIPVNIPGDLKAATAHWNLLQKAKGGEFFDELHDYSETLKNHFTKTQAEKNLLRLGHKLWLLNRLVNLKLSRKEWAELESKSTEAGQGDSETSALWALFDSYVSFLISDPSPFFLFYQNAYAREDALFANLLKRMKEKKSSTGVLVSGGFHSEGVTGILKENNISYALISPLITEMPEENRYVAHMRGDVSWKNYFQIRGGKINLYDAFAQAATDLLLAPSFLSGEKASVLLKAWRDQILRDLALKGSISQASGYTRLIDKAAMKHVSAETVEKLKEEWSGKVNSFVAGLKNLKKENRLDAENIIRLSQRVNAGMPGASILAWNSIPLIKNRRVPAEWAAAFEEISFEPQAQSVSASAEPAGISSTEIGPVRVSGGAMEQILKPQDYFAEELFSVIRNSGNIASNEIAGRILERMIAGASRSELRFDKSVDYAALKGLDHVKNSTVISLQMEMGYSAGFLKGIEERFGKAVADQVAQATLTGGLGALMHDLFPSWKANGLDIIGIHPIWEEIKKKPYPEGPLNLGQYQRRLMEEQMAARGEEVIELSINLPWDEEYRRYAEGNPKAKAAYGRTVRVRALKEYTSQYGAPNYHLDAYYLKDENQPDTEENRQRVFDTVYSDDHTAWREYHMAVYARASEMLIKILKQQGVIKEKTIEIHNEVFVSIPKAESDPNRTIVHINHSAYLPTIFSPNAASYGLLGFPAWMRQYIVKDGKSISIVDFAALNYDLLTGVAIDEHYWVLRRNIFRNAGARLDHYNDGEIRSTNGVLTEHWQSPALQNLVDQTRIKLGLPEKVDSRIFYETLEANPALREEFVTRQEFIKSAEVVNFLIWMADIQKQPLWLEETIRETGLSREELQHFARAVEESSVSGSAADWELKAFEKLRNTLLLHPMVSNVRRQVPYKGPEKWLEVLWALKNSPQKLEEFKRTKIRVVIGGRTFSGEADNDFRSMKRLTEDLGLQGHFAFIENYNVYDAAYMFRAMAGVVMLSDEFLEASATSMMKGVVNGAALIGVWGGAMPELFKILDENGKVIDIFEKKIPHNLVYRNLKNKKWKLVNGFMVRYSNEKSLQAGGGRRPEAEALAQSLSWLHDQYADPAKRRELLWQSVAGTPKVDMREGQARAHMQLIERLLREKERVQQAVFAKVSFNPGDMEKMLSPTAAKFVWRRGEAQIFKAGDNSPPGIFGLVNMLREISTYGEGDERGQAAADALRHHAMRGDIFNYILDQLKDASPALKSFAEEIKRLAAEAAPLPAELKRIQEDPEMEGEYQLGMARLTGLNIQAMELIERLGVWMAGQAFEAYLKERDPQKIAALNQKIFSNHFVRKYLARYLDGRPETVSLDTNDALLRAYGLTLEGKPFVFGVNVGSPLIYGIDGAQNKARGEILFSSPLQRFAESFIPDYKQLKNSNQRAVFQVVNGKIAGEEYGFYDLTQPRSNISLGLPEPEGIQLLGLERREDPAMDFLITTRAETFDAEALTRFLANLQAKAKDENGKIRQEVLDRLLEPISKLNAETARARFGRYLPAVMALVAGLSPRLLDRMQFWNVMVYTSLKKTLAENQELFDRGEIVFHATNRQQTVVFSRSMDGGENGKNMIFALQFSEGPVNRNDGKVWSRILEVYPLKLQPENEYEVRNLLSGFAYQAVRTGTDLLDGWLIGIPVEDFYERNEKIRHGWGFDIYQIRSVTPRFDLIRPEEETDTVQATVPNLIVAVNMLDLGASYDNASASVRTAGAIPKLSSLLSLWKEVGFGTVYPYGLYETGKISRGLHSVEDASIHWIGDTADGTLPRVLVSVNGYETKRRGNLRDNHGNNFSPQDLTTVDPRHSGSDFSPEAGTAEKSAEELSNLMKQMKAEGLGAIFDFIHWRAPESVNVSNYKQYFYRELTEDEREDWEAAHNDVARLAVMKNLTRTGGYFAARISEDGKERLILVQHMYNEPGRDQAVRNPFNPDVIAKSKKEIEVAIDRGARGIRIDLAHKLLNSELKPMMEKWAAEGWSTDPSGAYRSGYEPLKDLIEHGKRYAAAKEQEFFVIAEAYMPYHHDQLRSVGADAVYYENLYKDYVKIASGTSGLSARNLADGILTAFQKRDLFSFPSNYDVSPLKHTRGSREAFLLPLVILALSGVPVMIDGRELIDQHGQLVPIPGRDHPFPTDEEIRKRRDFDHFRWQMEGSPFVHMVRRFLDLIDGRKLTNLKVIDNQNRDQFISLDLEFEQKKGRKTVKDHLLVVLNIKPTNDQTIWSEWPGAKTQSVADMVSGETFAVKNGKAEGLVFPANIQYRILARSEALSEESRSELRMGPVNSQELLRRLEAIYLEPGEKNFQKKLFLFMDPNLHDQSNSDLHDQIINSDTIPLMEVLRQRFQQTGREMYQDIAYTLFRIIANHVMFDAHRFAEFSREDVWNFSELQKSFEKTEFIYANLETIAKTMSDFITIDGLSTFYMPQARKNMAVLEKYLKAHPNSVEPDGIIGATKRTSILFSYWVRFLLRWSVLIKGENDRETDHALQSGDIFLIGSELFYVQSATRENKDFGGEMHLIELNSMKQYVIRRWALFGRGPLNDFNLEAKSVSRRHAAVFFSGRDWRIEDLKSRNGVLLYPGLRRSELRLPTGPGGSEAVPRQEQRGELRMQKSADFGKLEKAFREETGRDNTRELSFLDAEQVTTLWKRFNLLGKEDAHGRRRWVKDVAWLAGAQLVKTYPDLIHLPALTRKLEAQEWISAQQKANLERVLEERGQEVKSQLAEGRAILVHGVEVRFDPVERKFTFRQEPSLEKYKTETLVARAPPRVVISVLVYNGWEDTKKLIKSLSSMETPNVELIIMDNGSSENHFRELADLAENSRYKLTLIKSPVNLGFDEGQNVAIDYALDDAPADHVFVLNNDLEADPRFIDELLKALEEKSSEFSRIGSIGPAVYQAEEGTHTSIIQSYGAHFPKNAMLKTTVIRKGQNGEAIAPEIVKVDYVVGPAVLFSSQALRLIGSYDPRFFAYGEELDMGIRLEEAGFASFVTNRAKIWHEGGRSSAGALRPFIYQQNIRNDFLLLRKHAAVRDIRSLIRLVLTIVNQLLQSFKEGWRTNNPEHFIAPLRGLKMGLLGDFSRAQAQALEFFEPTSSGITFLRATEPEASVRSELRTAEEDERILKNVALEGISPEMPFVVSGEVIGWEPKKNRFNVSLVRPHASKKNKKAAVKNEIAALNEIWKTVEDELKKNSNNKTALKTTKRFLRQVDKRIEKQNQKAEAAIDWLLEQSDQGRRLPEETKKILKEHLIPALSNREEIIFIKKSTRKLSAAQAKQLIIDRYQEQMMIKIYGVILNLPYGFNTNDERVANDERLLAGSRRDAMEKQAKRIIQEIAKGKSAKLAIRPAIEAMSEEAQERHESLEEARRQLVIEPKNETYQGMIKVNQHHYDTALEQIGYLESLASSFDTYDYVYELNDAEEQKAKRSLEELQTHVESLSIALKYFPEDSYPGIRNYAARLNETIEKEIEKGRPIGYAAAKFFSQNAAETQGVSFEFLMRYFDIVENGDPDRKSDRPIVVVADRIDNETDYNKLLGNSRSRGKVVAIVTPKREGELRIPHWYIFAKKSGIVVIVSLDFRQKNLSFSDVSRFQEGIVDGKKGIFVINPTPEILEQYQALGETYKLKDDFEREGALLPAVFDGRSVNIYADETSLEALKDTEGKGSLLVRSGAKGNGLYRLEELLLADPHRPGIELDDDRLSLAILDTLTQAPFNQGARFVIRLFDVAPDKFPKFVRDAIQGSNPVWNQKEIEANLTGARFYLTKDPIYAEFREFGKRQLKSIFKAFIVSKIRNPEVTPGIEILISDVRSAAEVFGIEEFINEAKENFLEEVLNEPSLAKSLGISDPKQISDLIDTLPVGYMFEDTVAVEKEREAMLRAVKEVQKLKSAKRFIGIGSNDLNKTINKERMDSKAPLNFLNTYLVRDIAMVARSAREYDLPVNLEGEWGGSGTMLMTLLALWKMEGLEITPVAAILRIPELLELVRNAKPEDFSKPFEYLGRSYPAFSDLLGKVLDGRELSTVREFHDTATALQGLIQSRILDSPEYQKFVEARKQTAAEESPAASEDTTEAPAAAERLRHIENLGDGRVSEKREYVLGYPGWHMTPGGTIKEWLGINKQQREAFLLLNGERRPVASLGLGVADSERAHIILELIGESLEEVENLFKKLEALEEFPDFVFDQKGYEFRLRSFDPNLEHFGKTPTLRSELRSLVENTISDGLEDAFEAGREFDNEYLLEVKRQPRNQFNPKFIPLRQIQPLKFGEGSFQGEGSASYRLFYMNSLIDLLSEELTETLMDLTAQEMTRTELLMREIQTGRTVRVGDLMPPQEFNIQAQKSEVKFLTELQGALRKGGISPEETEFTAQSFQDEMKAAMGWAGERVRADLPDYKPGIVRLNAMALFLDRFRESLGTHKENFRLRSQVSRSELRTAFDEERESIVIKLQQMAEQFSNVQKKSNPLATAIQGVSAENLHERIEAIMRTLIRTSLDEIEKAAELQKQIGAKVSTRQSRQAFEKSKQALQQNISVFAGYVRYANKVLQLYYHSLDTLEAKRKLMATLIQSVAFFSNDTASLENSRMQMVQLFQDLGMKPHEKMLLDLLISDEKMHPESRLWALGMHSSMISGDYYQTPEDIRGVMKFYEEIHRNYVRLREEAGQDPDDEMGLAVLADMIPQFVMMGTEESLERAIEIGDQIKARDFFEGQLESIMAVAKRKLALKIAEKDPKRAERLFQEASQHALEYGVAVIDESRPDIRKQWVAYVKASDQFYRGNFSEAVKLYLEVSKSKEFDLGVLMRTIFDYIVIDSVMTQGAETKSLIDLAFKELARADSKNRDTMVWHILVGFKEGQFETILDFFKNPENWPRGAEELAALTWFLLKHKAYGSKPEDFISALELKIKDILDRGAKPSEVMGDIRQVLEAVREHDPVVARRLTMNLIPALKDRDAQLEAWLREYLSLDIKRTLSDENVENYLVVLLQETDPAKQSSFHKDYIARELNSILHAKLIETGFKPLAVLDFLEKVEKKMQAMTFGGATSLAPYVHTAFFELLTEEAGLFQDVDETPGQNYRKVMTRELDALLTRYASITKRFSVDPNVLSLYFSQLELANLLKGKNDPVFVKGVAKFFDVYFDLLKNSRARVVHPGALRYYASYAGSMLEQKSPEEIETILAVWAKDIEFWMKRSAAGENRISKRDMVEYLFQGISYMKAELWQRIAESKGPLREAILKSIRAAQEIYDFENDSESAIHFASVTYTLGEEALFFDMAKIAMDHLDVEVIRGENEGFRALMAMLHLRVSALRQGDAALAEQAGEKFEEIKRRFKNLSADSTFGFEFAITDADYLLTKGQYEQAIDRLQTILAQVSEVESRRLFVQLFLNAAYRLAGRQEESLAAAKQTLPEASAKEKMKMPLFSEHRSDLIFYKINTVSEHLQAAVQSYWQLLFEDPELTPQQIKEILNLLVYFDKENMSNKISEYLDQVVSQEAPIVAQRELGLLNWLAGEGANFGYVYYLTQRFIQPRNSDQAVNKQIIKIRDAAKNQFSAEDYYEAAEREFAAGNYGSVVALIDEAGKRFQKTLDPKAGPALKLLDLKARAASAKSHMDELEEGYREGGIGSAEYHLTALKQAGFSNAKTARIGRNLSVMRDAVVLIKDGRPQEALDLFEQISDQDRDQEIKKRARALEDFIKSTSETQAKLSEKKHGEAEGLLNKAIERFDQQAKLGAMPNLGRVKSLRDDIDEARRRVEELKAVIRVNGQYRLMLESAVELASYPEETQASFNLLLEKSHEAFQAAGRVIQTGPGTMTVARGDGSQETLVVDLKNVPETEKRQRETLYLKAFHTGRLVFELLRFGYKSKPDVIAKAQAVMGHAAANLRLPKMVDDAAIVNAMAEAENRRDERETRARQRIEKVKKLKLATNFELQFSSLQIEKTKFKVKNINPPLETDALRGIILPGDTFTIRHEDSKEDLPVFFKVESISDNGEITFEMPKLYEGREEVVKELSRIARDKKGVMTRMRDTTWERQRKAMGEIVSKLLETVRTDLSLDKSFIPDATTGRGLIDKALGIHVPIPVPESIRQIQDQDDRNRAWLERVEAAEKQKKAAAGIDDWMLDPPQKEAILDALNTQEPVVFIQGPGGTGKTTVISLATGMFYDSRKNVMIVAQQNNAIDNAGVRLGKEVVFARVGNSDQAISEAEIREIWDRKKEILKTMGQQLTAQKSQSGTGKSQADHKGAVILGTTNGALTDRELLKYPALVDSVRILIVDESSRATFPELLTLIHSLPRLEKVIFVGDHKQLPAYGISEEDAKIAFDELGGKELTEFSFKIGRHTFTRKVKGHIFNDVKIDHFRTSILEETLDLFLSGDENEEKIYVTTRPRFNFLNIQRRSGYRIVDVNNHFYDDKLVAGRTDPGVVIEDDTEGLSRETSDRRGDFDGSNAGEADRVIGWVNKLMNGEVDRWMGLGQKTREKLKAKDIAVVTPYNNQIDLIQTTLYDIARLHELIRSVETQTLPASESVGVQNEILQLMQTPSVRRRVDVHELSRAVADIQKGFDRVKAERLRKFLSLGEVFVTPEELDRGEFTVITVDSSIGHEYKAVIHSWVRSNPKGNMGFLARLVDGFKRRNVATGRPQDYEIWIWDRGTFENTQRFRELNEWVTKTVAKFQEFEAEDRRFASGQEPGRRSELRNQIKEDLFFNSAVTPLTLEVLEALVPQPLLKDVIGKKYKLPKGFKTPSDSSAPEAGLGIYKKEGRIRFLLTDPRRNNFEFFKIPLIAEGERLSVGIGHMNKFEEARTRYGDYADPVFAWWFIENLKPFAIRAGFREIEILQGPMADSDLEKMEFKKADDEFGVEIWVHRFDEARPESRSELRQLAQPVLRSLATNTEIARSAEIITGISTALDNFTSELLGEAPAFAETYANARLFGNPSRVVSFYREHPEYDQKLAIFLRANLDETESFIREYFLNNAQADRLHFAFVMPFSPKQEIQDWWLGFLGKIKEISKRPEFEGKTISAAVRILATPEEIKNHPQFFENLKTTGLADVIAEDEKTSVAMRVNQFLIQNPNALVYAVSETLKRSIADKRRVVSLGENIFWEEAFAVSTLINFKTAQAEDITSELLKQIPDDLPMGMAAFNNGGLVIAEAARSLALEAQVSRLIATMA